MKKIFLLLTAVLTAGMLSAETIYGDCGTNMEWEFNTGSGALFLIGSGPMDDYNSFDETPWAQYGDQIKSIQKDSRSQYTTIGDYAFFGCQNLTSVDLPNSVTSIGDDAFYGCSDLTSVTIPNSVTSIGNYAFYYCVGLTSVTIPNSVTSIGDDAFYGCRGLTSVTIPNSVTSIGDYAFDNCTGLTFVTIPNSVTSIGNYAFYGCSSLTSVTIPNSVTSIGDFAFYRCSGLTSVTILNSVTSIGNYAFYGCSGLTALTIGEGVTSIGDWAFHNCSGLTSVTIPNSVTSIGYHAFDGCSSLTALTIGEGITSIGDWAFYNCTGLTTITCKAVNPPALGENVFYSTTIPLYVPASSVNTYKSTAPWSYFGNNILPIGGYITSGICGKDGEGNLADNLTWTFDPETGTLTIEGSGEMMDFDYNGIPWLDFAMQITNVTLPDGLTSIGARAFYDCSSLASINIPESVTEIKMLAFFYCSSLTSIVIPEGTKSLFETFKGCESLSSVVIPASVTSLTFYTFGGCVSLKEITNYATTPQSVEEDVFDQVDKANCKLYVPSSAVEAYKATEVWKDFDIQAAQGIEDIVVPTGEAQKILMNGTLLIERNGKTYNAQGAEVR